MKKLLYILRIAAAACLLLLLCLNLWLLGSRFILKQDLPKIFGYSQAAVVSGSMEPAFSPGDLLVFREQSAYAAGDIIIFRQDDAFVTHRIVEKTGDKLVTKGDANDTADTEAVAVSRVEGRVVWVLPRVGHIMTFLKSPLGILLIVLAGLALAELPGTTGRKRNRGRRRPR